MFSWLVHTTAFMSTPGAGVMPALGSVRGIGHDPWKGGDPLAAVARVQAKLSMREA